MPTLRSAACLLMAAFALGRATAQEAPPPLSEASESCVGCHATVNPGLVEDWRHGRHAATTPAKGLALPTLQRRVSATDIPAALRDIAVGCFECHGANPGKHADDFEHFGYQIHTVVSPPDCAVCHKTEADQFADSKKAYALDNLQQNPLFSLLVDTATRSSIYAGGQLVHGANPQAKRQACYGCHGTEVKVDGTRKVASDAGEIELPRLTNWPNQGVGRHNPDGSRGACSACHPRHGFALEVARQPATCGGCHLEPDTPAYEVYMESKHGAIFASLGSTWNWEAVPWKPGVDFRAPTCATCHNSLLVSPEDGHVIAERTHDFGARLYVRLFGLPYAHPQPVHGRTYELRNADGQPLPTTFANKPAATGLIDAAEQAKRRQGMQTVCLACHSSGWAEGHFDGLDRTVTETNAMVLTATQTLQRAWAAGLAKKANPFDEEIERRWVRQWLFNGSSIRYAAAMGGPDYAAFKNGWFQMTGDLQSMLEWLGRQKR